MQGATRSQPHALLKDGHIGASSHTIGSTRAVSGCHAHAHLPEHGAASRSLTTYSQVLLGLGECLCIEELGLVGVLGWNPYTTIFAEPREAVDGSPPIDTWPVPLHSLVASLYLNLVLYPSNFIYRQEK